VKSAPYHGVGSVVRPFGYLAAPVDNRSGNAPVDLVLQINEVVGADWYARSPEATIGLEGRIAYLDDIAAAAGDPEHESSTGHKRDESYTERNEDDGTVHRSGQCEDYPDECQCITEYADLHESLEPYKMADRFRVSGMCNEHEITSG
jgi:hypothetical protein